MSSRRGTTGGLGVVAAIGAVISIGPRPVEATSCWTYNNVVCVFASGVDSLRCYPSEAACQEWHPTPEDGCWTYAGGESCEFSTGVPATQCSVSETQCRQAHLLCWTHDGMECTQGGGSPLSDCFPSRGTCEDAAGGMGGGGGDGGGDPGDGGMGCWANPEGSGCHRSATADQSQCFISREDCESSTGGADCWSYDGVGGTCEPGDASGSVSECFGTKAECEARRGFGSFGCWQWDGVTSCHESGGENPAQCWETRFDCEQHHISTTRRLDGFLAHV